MLRPLKTKQSQQEADRREQNAEQRPQQGRPITGGQRGPATGSLSWYEDRIAKSEMSNEDWTAYLELRSKNNLD